MGILRTRPNEGGGYAAQKAFESVARYVWPIARRFVRITRRCRTCILSEKHGPLRDGLCAECMAYRRVEADGADPVRLERLNQTIRAHLHGHARYHALLLLSGGKDSAYLLERMKRDYPALRMLCVLINTGFQSPLAIANVRYVAEKLQTDLWIVNAEQDRFTHALRQAFLDLKGRGAYQVVDKADGDLIFALGRQAALDLNIPMMLAGLSSAQMQRIFGLDDFQMIQQDGVLTVCPLAAWQVSETNIRETVRNLKLLPPGGDSPVVSNHAFVLPMSVLDVMNLGYCSFEPEFAQLVREGRADRKTWLHLFELLEFATQKGLLARELRKGLARLGLSPADVIGGHP